MAKILATPKAGVLVRQENGKPLPPGGDIVERNSYWLRRERDGDVTLSDAPEAAEAAEAADIVADPVPKKPRG
jgi:Protein of unknown function (DUF2635)